ncbi:MAG: hypothetical protein GX971_11420 [Firmicutes bacterium]|nr:hypothetical protein [Bacillota bacterium]
MGKGLRQKLISIIFALVLIGVGFVAGQYYLHRAYQTQVEAGYRRALSELGTHFQALTAEMGRARLAVSPGQRSLIGANLRSLIYAVQSNLGELPLGEVNLEGVCQLLDELYEQTYFYSQEKLDPTTIDELYGQVQYVNHELNQLVLHKQFEYPWVSWHEYLTTSVVVPDFLQAFALINAGLGEIRIGTSLVQDGVFKRGEILGESIGREQAVEVARTFIGQGSLNFQVTNETKGAIPSYTVEAKDGEERIIVEVSQKGGLVLWMVHSREIRESGLSAEEMVARGARFLEERGFPPLNVTDLQVLQNKATITFVPARDGILRYGEPLKVQVSAADGSILGFWGTPFYVAQSREGEVELAKEINWIPQDKIRSDLEILDEKLVLIELEGQGEVLTTRLGVRYQDDYYLIYLNADTGEEEQIVQVSSPQFF